MKKIKDFFTSIEWSTVDPAVIVRYILAIVAAINLILKYTGVVPIEVNENIVYNVVSIVLTVIVIIMNTYKNNSTSPQAIIADSIMRLLKASAEVDPKKSNNALEAINAILSDVKNDMVTKTGVDTTDNDVDVRSVDAVGLDDIDCDEPKAALNADDVCCDDEVDEAIKEKYNDLMLEYASILGSPDLEKEISDISSDIQTYLRENLSDAVVVTPIMNTSDGGTFTPIISGFYRNLEDPDNPDAIRFTGNIEIYHITGTGNTESDEDIAILESASNFMIPLIAKLESKYGLEIRQSFMIPCERTTDEEPGSFMINVEGPIIE